MTAPFTLIAFHLNEIDLDDPRRGGETPLGMILESTKEHRVEIYLGAYVFDTRKGWQDMYRLCEFLRIRNRSFLRLPFEGELFGHTAPAIAEALGKVGVSLYRYPIEPR